MRVGATHANIGKKKVNALTSKFILSTLIAATIGSSAVGMDVNDCSSEPNVGIHGLEGDYADLGNSLVLFTGGGYPDGEGGLSEYFVNCKSGETLVANVSYQKAGKVEYDHHDVPKSMILEMVRSPTLYSFSDVLSAFKQRGIEARLSTADEEICACMVLYPADRGSKKKYQSLRVNP